MKPAMKVAEDQRLPDVSLWFRALGSSAALLILFAYPKEHFAKQESSLANVSVHEWGTFTSISDSDGHAID